MSNVLEKQWPARRSGWSTTLVSREMHTNARAYCHARQSCDWRVNGTGRILLGCLILPRLLSAWWSCKGPKTLFDCHVRARCHHCQPGPSRLPDPSQEHSNFISLDDHETLDPITEQCKAKRRSRERLPGFWASPSSAMECMNGE